MKSETTVATATNTMTSMQIAEVTGKTHKEVMRAIRAMEPAWEKVCESILGVCGRKFALTSQKVDMPNGGFREEPCYSLTKTESLYIATKFNDEARARLILRWEELEELSLYNPDEPETVYDLAKALEASYITNKALWHCIHGKAKALELIQNYRHDADDLHGKLDYIIAVLGEIIGWYRSWINPVPDILPERVEEIVAQFRAKAKGGAL